MQIIKKILIICYVILVSEFLFCHPHLFIKPLIKVVINNNIVEGINVSWEWDDWWSADVIDACDRDKNGNFDSKEAELIYKDFFIGIKDFGFFTSLYIDNKRIQIKKINNFNAYIKGNVVIYDFMIPVDVPISDNINVKIIFNDETIYTAFDEKIYIIDNENDNYKNIKIESYSYYGRQIIFDYKL